MLQCVEVWCSVVQCVAGCCSVLQCVALSMSVSPIAFTLHCDAVWCCTLQCFAVRCSVWRCGAVCCSVSHWAISGIALLLLQCGAVCCIALQWVAVSSFRHRPLHSHNTMLQGVAQWAVFGIAHCIHTTLCCRVLQSVAGCCSVLHLFLHSCTFALPLCCSVLQCVAVCSTFPCARARRPQTFRYTMLQRIAACCIVLQHVAPFLALLRVSLSLVVLSFLTLCFLDFFAFFLGLALNPFDRSLLIKVVDRMHKIRILRRRWRWLCVTWLVHMWVCVGACHIDSAAPVAAAVCDMARSYARHDTWDMHESRHIFCFNKHKIRILRRQWRRVWETCVTWLVDAHEPTHFLCVMKIYVHCSTLQHTTTHATICRVGCGGGVFYVKLFCMYTYLHI